MFTLALPFLLGLTHSFEADHILAVATMNPQQQSIKKTVWNGIVWGIGHSIPIILLGMVFIAYKFLFQNLVPFHLEVLVGVMLIFTGGYKIIAQNTKQIKRNHFLLIGIIHGIAGSVGLVLMSFMNQDSIYLQVLCLLVFSLGAIVGMGGVNVILSKTSQLIEKARFLTYLIPLISIAYGGFLIIANI